LELACRRVDGPEGISQSATPCTAGLENGARLSFARLQALRLISKRHFMGKEASSF